MGSAPRRHPRRSSIGRVRGSGSSPIGDATTGSTWIRSAAANTRSAAPRSPSSSWRSPRRATIRRRPGSSPRRGGPPRCGRRSCRTGRGSSATASPGSPGGSVPAAASARAPGAVRPPTVRARAAEAIGGLERQGCGRIVIVAHSGGAIVSFTTLLDPVYLERKVDKLITIGGGLGLAWHLVDRNQLPDRGNRLAGDLASTRPDLLWYDYWASYDPAPGGPLRHPRGLPLPVTSRPVTNRMSIFEDHGSYWENDEGFLVALIRHLDTAGGAPPGGPGGPGS